MGRGFVFRNRRFSTEKKVVFLGEIENAALLHGISGLLKTLQTNTVILGLLAVVIALIGFLIANFTQNPWEMFRSAGISLIVFSVNFPRKNVWKKIVSTLERI